MKEHFWLAGFVVVCWFVLLAIWFPLFGLRAGATEHARMFDEFVPTTYDRVLDVGTFVLFAPVALARFVIPNSFRGGEARDIIALLLFNSFAIGIAALLLSVVFHRFKNRKRNVSDNFNNIE